MPVVVIEVDDVDTHEVHPQPKVLIVVPPNRDEYFLLMSIIMFHKVNTFIIFSKILDKIYKH